MYREEELKKMDEEDEKAWEAAAENELKKKCEMLMPSFDKGKSKQGLLSKSKKGSFKVGFKSLCPKPETTKDKKLTHTPTFKKDDPKKIFK
jgi:hypothetical protein